MDAFNHGMNALFDLLLRPVESWPVLALALSALAASSGALLLFKAVTPQHKLTTVRDRLFGHIYEMGLYQDHLGVVARIQADLVRANARYLCLTVPALLVMAVPMALLLGQMESRFNHRSLRVGEETVLAVWLAEDADLAAADLKLELPVGLALVAGPVRASGAVAWRMRVTERGNQEIILRGAGQLLTRCVVPVGQGLAAMGQTSTRSWWQAVLSPGAPVLGEGKQLAKLSRSLPSRTISWAGVHLDWLLAFMVFSLAGGLAIKELLGVSI